MTFCTDTDLLYWEPSLFADAAAVAQALISGNAAVAGTGATISAGSLETAGVAAGNVIQFAGGNVAGAFPIVSVDSATELTMTVLYDGLDAETLLPAAHLGTASGQAFSIRTFFAQRKAATDDVLTAAGFDPASADDVGKVVNRSALRRPTVLGALWLIYSARAAIASQEAADAVGAAAGPDAASVAAGRDRQVATLTARAQVYERLYRRALRSVRLLIDTNGDGQGDEVRDLSIAAFKRA